MKSLVFPLVLATALVSGCATTTVGDAPQTQEQRAAEANTKLGVEYLRRGNLEQAMDKLSRAVKQNPSLPEAQAAIAVLYERLGEDGKASTHFERAVRLAPDDSSILNNYGSFLCQQRKLAEAEGYFRRAADNPLYRSREVPLTNAGICLLRADQRERGERYLLEALQANPRFPPALLRMAQLRLEADHPLSARGFYQRYVEVSPQTAETLWLGVRIERALGNRNAEASYALALRSRFPDSEEARKLIELERDDR